MPHGMLAERPPIFISDVKFAFKLHNYANREREKSFRMQGYPGV